jgi:hypothetical protein
MQGSSSSSSELTLRLHTAHGDSTPYPSSTGSRPHTAPAGGRPRHLHASSPTPLVPVTRGPMVELARASDGSIVEGREKALAIEC